VVVKVLDKPELAATGMVAWTRMLGKVFFARMGARYGHRQAKSGKKNYMCFGNLGGLGLITTATTHSEGETEERACANAAMACCACTCIWSAAG
jgi:hypothetical protein